MSCLFDERPFQKKILNTSFKTRLMRGPLKQKIKNLVDERSSKSNPGLDTSHHQFQSSLCISWQAHSQKADLFKLNYFALLNFFVIKKAEYNQRTLKMLENNHQFT